MRQETMKDFLKIENSIQLLQSKPSMAETAYKNEEEELKKRKNKVDNDLKSIEAKLVDIDRLITTQDEKIKAYKQYIDRKTADTKVYIPQSSNKNEFTCKMCEHSFKSKYVLGKHMKSEHPLNIKCSYCDSTFEATIELEKHMHELHGTKALKCNQCEAKFFSKWRLNKHMEMHQSTIIRNCYYFNSGIQCPFEKIGCKFKHVLSEKCKYGDRCEKAKCQFGHRKTKQ